MDALAENISLSLEVTADKNSNIRSELIDSLKKELKMELVKLEFVINDDSRNKLIIKVTKLNKENGFSAGVKKVLSFSIFAAAGMTQRTSNEIRADAYLEKGGSKELLNGISPYDINSRKFNNMVKNASGIFAREVLFKIIIPPNY